MNEWLFRQNQTILSWFHTFFNIVNILKLRQNLNAIYQLCFVSFYSFISLSVYILGKIEHSVNENVKKWYSWALVWQVCSFSSFFFIWCLLFLLFFFIALHWWLTIRFGLKTTRKKIIFFQKLFWVCNLATMVCKIIFSYIFLIFSCSHFSFITG